MITKKSKYALKALSILTEEYSRHRPVLISDLAKRGRMPKKFLEVILLELKNNGVLQSKMGKGGGYSLVRPPDQIMLSSVMRILEGPLSPLPCLSQTSYQKCDDCEDENTCSIRMVMKELHRATVTILDGTSLQDMIDGVKNLQAAGMYSI